VAKDAPSQAGALSRSQADRDLSNRLRAYVGLGLIQTTVFMH